MERKLPNIRYVNYRHSRAFASKCKDQVQKRGGEVISVLRVERYISTHWKLDSNSSHTAG